MRPIRGHSRNACSHKRRNEPVSTPEPPADLVDGLFATVEKDGRVRFDLARKRKSIAHVTLPANQAGELAAGALGGAYDAFDRAMMGAVPPGERKDNYPFVRITGLGLGPCPDRKSVV